MELEELNEKFRALIGEVRIEEALDLLIDWLNAHGLHEEHDDVVLLKANFKKARYQFEVQGTLPRTDFDLVQNRTVSASQAVVRGLKETVARGTNKDTRTRPGRAWIWGGVAVAALAGLLYWAAARPGLVKEEPKMTREDTVLRPIQTRDSNSGALVRPPVVPNGVKPAPPATDLKKKEGEEDAEKPSKEGVTSDNQKKYTLTMILNAEMQDAVVLVNNTKVAVESRPTFKKIYLTRGEYDIVLQKGEMRCEVKVDIGSDKKLSQSDFTCQ